MQRVGAQQLMIQFPVKDRIPGNVAATGNQQENKPKHSVSTTHFGQILSGTAVVQIPNSCCPRAIYLASAGDNFMFTPAHYVPYVLPVRRFAAKAGHEANELGTPGSIVG